MSSTINANDNNSQFLNTVISNGAASAGANQTVSSDQSNSWFEALAKAWGNALDQQANKVTALSDQVSDGTDASASDQTGSTQNGTSGSGSDNPSVLTQLTAESLKMQFLSTSASTSVNAVGQGLQTLGQKQS